MCSTGTLTQNPPPTSSLPSAQPQQRQQPNQQQQQQHQKQQQQQVVEPPKMAIRSKTTLGFKGSASQNRAKPGTSVIVRRRMQAQGEVNIKRLFFELT